MLQIGSVKVIKYYLHYYWIVQVFLSDALAESKAHWASTSSTGWAPFSEGFGIGRDLDCWLDRLVETVFVFISTLAQSIVYSHGPLLIGLALNYFSILPDSSPLELLWFVVVLCFSFVSLPDIFITSIHQSYTFWMQHVARKSVSR